MGAPVDGLSCVVLHWIRSLTYLQRSPDALYQHLTKSRPSLIEDTELEDTFSGRLEAHQPMRGLNKTLGGMEETKLTMLDRIPVE